MAAGETFNPRQRADIDRAIRDAETVSRFEFSVFVGPCEGESRPFAERLHAALTAPERSVLVVVDPLGRQLEVVTGSEVRRELEDHEVQLAVLTMQGAFEAGDLVGGITQGLMMLAEHARTPQMRHAEKGMY